MSRLAKGKKCEVANRRELNRLVQRIPNQVRLPLVSRSRAVGAWSLGSSPRRASGSVEKVVPWKEIGFSI